jgi:hypothetical protein
MTYYDRDNYGYNMNNMRTGVREIGTRVRNRVSDVADTMGKRYEAYQQEQSEKAGDNPLLHVGLVPAAAGLFGGIKLLDMANNRQLRKEDAAMFAESLRNSGITDPAEIDRLSRLRADLAAKGVNPDLHATELAARGQITEADRKILSAGEAQMKKLKSMQTALGTEAAGAGMKTVSALDANERKFVENFMKSTKVPDSGGFNEHLQRVLRDPMATPEQKQMVASIAGKLKTMDDPSAVFRTMETLGAPVGITPAQASDIMEKRKAGRPIGPAATVVDKQVTPRPTSGRQAGVVAKHVRTPGGVAAAKMRAAYQNTGPAVSRLVRTGGNVAPVTNKAIDQVGKLGIETYKPGALRKMLGWVARLFGKRAHISPEFAMQKIAETPLVDPLIGHGFRRMVGNIQKNVVPQTETAKMESGADASREKIFSDIEKSTGRPFDMDRDSEEYVKRVGGPITQSVFDHMVRRGGSRAQNLGPNRGTMTADQEAQAKQQLSERGLGYTPDQLQWDPTLQAFRTDPGLKNRVGAYYDPKTGKIAELYPHGVADSEMQRLRPQAVMGREGTLADAFNPRLMWRDAKNAVRRVGEGAGSGATIGGGMTGGFAGFVPGAIVGALGGVGLANAENARNAANYDVRTGRDPNKRSVPLASGVFDFAKWTRPVYAGASEAIGALGNVGERMIAGDDGTIEKTLPEKAYYAVKPHVLRGFGRGEDNKR